MFCNCSLDQEKKDLECFYTMNFDLSYFMIDSTNHISYENIIDITKNDLKKTKLTESDTNIINNRENKIKSMQNTCDRSTNSNEENPYMIKTEVNLSLIKNKRGGLSENEILNKKKAKYYSTNNIIATCMLQGNQSIKKQTETSNLTYFPPNTSSHNKFEEKSTINNISINVNKSAEDDFLNNIKISNYKLKYDSKFITTNKILYHKETKYLVNILYNLEKKYKYLFLICISEVFTKVNSDSHKILKNEKVKIEEIVINTTMNAILYRLYLITYSFDFLMLRKDNKNEFIKLHYYNDFLINQITCINLQSNFNTTRKNNFNLILHVFDLIYYFKLSQNLLSNKLSKEDTKIFFIKCKGLVTLIEFKKKVLTEYKLENWFEDMKKEKIASRNFKTVKKVLNLKINDILQKINLFSLLKIYNLTEENNKEFRNNLYIEVSGILDILLNDDLGLQKNEVFKNDDYKKHLDRMNDLCYSNFSAQTFYFIKNRFICEIEKSALLLKQKIKNLNLINTDYLFKILDKKKKIDKFLKLVDIYIEKTCVLSYIMKVYLHFAREVSYI